MAGAALAQDYVRLALAIDQHLPGYIDAYYGPADWREQARLEGRRPPDELARRASALEDALGAAAEMDPQRKDYLARQVRAMRTSLRLLAGETLALADEADLLYDIRPTWIDEARFEEAHRQLDELLPPGDTLQERLTARKQALEISVEQARSLLPPIQERLREASRKRFPLPQAESLDFHFVESKPWAAYNWYLGNGRSRIELNTDLPLRANLLVELVAHEAYPGHHTELSIKDGRLLQQEGRLEHSVALINSPACVISEGIATCALSVIMPDDALLAWYTREIFPRAGLDPSHAQGEIKIQEATQTLTGARGNAAFLLHDRRAGPAESARYLQRYELRTEAEAAKQLEFLENPLYRSYVFTYYWGRQLLTSLFAAKGDVTHWYTRLLTEAVTPSQIRQWTAA